MTCLRRFLSDLALIPAIWRGLVAQERASRDLAEALRRYDEARAADIEGVAELQRLSTEMSSDHVANEIRRLQIKSRWERGPVRVVGSFR